MCDIGQTSILVAPNHRLIPKNFRVTKEVRFSFFTHYGKNVLKRISTKALARPGSFGKRVGWDKLLNPKYKTWIDSISESEVSCTGNGELGAIMGKTAHLA